MIQVSPSSGVVVRPRLASISRGYTLAETLIATALTSLVLLGVGSAMLLFGRLNLLISTGVSFQTADAETAGQFARDVRSSTSIRSYSSNTLVLAGSDGTDVQYQWSPSAGTFTRVRGGGSKLLLTGCTNLVYSFSKGPGTNVVGSFGTLSNVASTAGRIVRASWTCVRTNGAAHGSASETFTTAAIGIRD